MTGKAEEVRRVRKQAKEYLVILRPIMRHRGLLPTVISVQWGTTSVKVRAQYVKDTLMDLKKYNKPEIVVLARRKHYVI